MNQTELIISLMELNVTNAKSKGLKKATRKILKDFTDRHARRTKI